MSKMELFINGHDLFCIIGVWEHERTATQRVGLDIRLEFDGSKAANSDQLSDTSNYARLTDTAEFILKHGRFQLLESAVTVLTRFLLLPVLDFYSGASASHAEVQITKYDALPGDTLARLRFSASIDEMNYAHETPDWGRVDIIAETATLGLYCLHIAPGKTLPLHHHEIMSESEYILDDGLVLLTLDKDPAHLSAGATFSWAHGVVHGYRNLSDEWCRVLCIDSPPFIPEDEILWRHSK